MLRNKLKRILEIILVISFLIMGGCIYYLYDNISVAFKKQTPLKVLCIKGNAFTQVEPKSTVYIKTDRECYSKEKKVIYAL